MISTSSANVSNLMIVPIILSHILPCYPLFILLKGKRFGTQFSNLMGSEWTPPSNPPPPPPAEVEEDDDKLSNSKPTVRKHNPNKSKSSKNAKAIDQLGTTKILSAAELQIFNILLCKLQRGHSEKSQA